MSSMERYTIREVADMSIEYLKRFFAFEADEPEHIDDIVGLRVKMCVWLGVSRGLDLAFLNAD